MFSGHTKCPHCASNLRFLRNFSAVGPKQYPTRRSQKNQVPEHMSLDSGPWNQVPGLRSLDSAALCTITRLKVSINMLHNVETFKIFSGHSKCPHCASNLRFLRNFSAVGPKQCPTRRSQKNRDIRENVAPLTVQKRFRRVLPIKSLQTDG